MRTTISALIAALALTLGAASARADGWYFGEAVGHTTIDGEMASYFDDSYSVAVRIALGRQIGHWTVDAYLQVMDLPGAGLFDSVDFSAATVGLDARYIMPVAGPLQVYLRGGLNKMSVYTVDGTEYARGDVRVPLRDDYEGRGINYGAGVRLSGKVRALGLLWWPLFFLNRGPKVNASLYLDTSRQFVRLHNPRGPTIDGTLDTWTIGFSIGGGF